MSKVQIALAATVPQYGSSDGHAAVLATHIDSFTISSAAGQVEVVEVPATNADSGTTEHLHKVWRVANAGSEHIIVRFDLPNASGGSSVLNDGSNGFLVVANSTAEFKVTNSAHIAKVINSA